MEKIIKHIGLLYILLTLFATGCENSSDNNHSLEYTTLTVNFEGSLLNGTWNDGAQIGIFASCTRNEEQHVSMSANVNAKYTASAGETAHLLKASDNDLIVANMSDHNFQFYAYYPYSGAITNLSSIEVSVPSKQDYATGAMNYGAYVANKQVTTIVPTVKLEFRGLFSLLDLYLPNDITDDDGHSTIRSLTLKPVVAENFTGTLTAGGTYNLETETFTENPSMQGDSVQLDFGATGLTLTNAFTKVSLAVAPFTVPVGGMSVVVTDMSGIEKTVSMLTKDEDAGIALSAGEGLTVYLSSDDDGIIPVTFPVVFPLGSPYNGEAQGAFHATRQPRWVNEGYWICLTQSQAYATWTWVSTLTPAPFRETINSGVISSPGVKGIWTGDYFEFVLPVKKFAAGTSVTMEFPVLTRFAPAFWNIEYYDDEQWKCNKTNVTCFNRTEQATFAINSYNAGIIIEHTMTFTKAIKSGYVKIRLTCANGSLLVGNGVVEEYAKPHTNAAGTAYDAPFYFYKASSDVTSITFSVN